MSTAAPVLDIVSAFLVRVEKVPPGPVTPGTALFAEGLDLDSLEIAELSAILEDRLGADPFNQADMPQTVGDLQDYFAAAPEAS